MPTEVSSSGHKLGQIIGDWYEKYFALPLLTDIAHSLNLFIDSRFIQRNCRDDRIIWNDLDGNTVDYDFVMELGGNSEIKGTPIAFFETFWRRGARHSKDKARDDTGKLTPMKATYPTARMLGIVAAGDFTKPAMDLVYSRGVELFYISKSKIIESWFQNGLQIDYPDRSSEEEKKIIAERIENTLEQRPDTLQNTADCLRNIVGKSQLQSFKNKVYSKLGATPQSYRITIQKSSLPICFSNYTEVDCFIDNIDNVCELPSISYAYEVIFGDGDYFSAQSLTRDELQKRHNQLKTLIQHMENL